MRDVIDVTGASGTAYRFRRLEHHSAAPATAGNFLYVRWENAAAVLLYVGDADTLTAIQARWPDAQTKHGATDIYYRLNVGREVRHRERDDILERERPPMNRGGSQA
jgi:hypothetical protein